MKDSKQMLESEFRNEQWLFNYIKNKEDDKVIRMFGLFNLSSKLEYKAIEVGNFEIAYKTVDLQTKIIDFIMRSLRRKQE